MRKTAIASGKIAIIGNCVGGGASIQPPEELLKLLESFQNRLASGNISINMRQGRIMGYTTQEFLNVEKSG